MPRKAEYTRAFDEQKEDPEEEARKGDYSRTERRHRDAGDKSALTRPFGDSEEIEYVRCH